MNTIFTKSELDKIVGLPHYQYMEYLFELLRATKEEMKIK